MPAASANALAAQGLAFPVGHCGSVPLSGYLLSGGLGWNMGAWGPACFSLEGLEVITAGGELLTADRGQHPDLLWAARGAGPGFFGVATRFHLRVYPLPKAIMTSVLLYPLADVEEIGRWATQLVPSMPPAMELLLMLGSAPAGRAAGPAGKAVAVMAAAFAETEDEARDWLALLETCPCISRALVRQVNQPSSFEALHDMNGARLPDGHRYAEDALWSDGDLAALLPCLAEHIVTSPSAKSLFVTAMSPSRDAGARASDAAFSTLGRTFLLGYAVWNDAADDARNEAWLRRAVASLEPNTVGHYVAETDLLASPSRPTSCFAARNWRRLTALKHRYDPQDLFHTYLGPE